MKRLSSEKSSAEYSDIIFKCISNRYVSIIEIAKHKYLHKKLIEDIPQEKSVKTFFNNSLFQYGISITDSMELSHTFLRICKSIQHSYFHQWYLMPSLPQIDHDNTLNITDIRDAIRASDTKLINAIGSMKINNLLFSADFNFTSMQCYVFVESTMISQIIEIISRIINNHHNWKH